jgi:hypothetical protein
MFRSVIFFAACTVTSVTSFFVVACLVSAYPCDETQMILREDNINEMVGSREENIKILGIESCKTKDLAV